MTDEIIAALALRYIKHCKETWMKQPMPATDIDKALLLSKMMLADSVAEFSELTNNAHAAEFLRDLADDLENMKAIPMS